jgi:uncharacterized protein
LTPVLLDAGVIVAMLDRSETYHSVCAEIVRKITAPLVTCEAVIAESCYLLRGVAGAAEAILGNVAAGTFQIPFRLSGVAPQIQAIFRRYKDREVDFADACLIHLATQLHTPDILTLDGDFQVYRWGAKKPFRNLIPL